MSWLSGKWIIVAMIVLSLNCFGESAEPKVANASNSYRITYSKTLATNVNELRAIFTVENLSEQPISVPYFKLGDDGVALGTMFGFRVYRDGEWKNPGVYYDGVLLKSVIKPKAKVPFLISIPTELIKPDEKFKVRFGSDLESPIFFRTITHKIIEVVH